MVDGRYGARGASVTSPADKECGLVPGPAITRHQRMVVTTAVEQQQTRHNVC